MSRWKPDARGRIAKAALDLYARRGYEQTTVAEIADRAGVTERTFFRHFADKREVVFGGSTRLQELMVNAVIGAPTSSTPIEAVAEALRAASGVLADRAFSQKRQAIINANPELRERELIKMARLASSIADALRRRGVREPTASLTAETGIAIFRVAFDRWVAPGSRGQLWELIRETLGQLRVLVSA